MRAALAVAIGLLIVPAAFAKGDVRMSLSTKTVRVGMPVTVTVETGWTLPLDDWLRVITVAPGKDWYQVVGTVTGDSKRTHANLPHDGFQVRMARVAPRTWRATVRLPRPGRWRIVLPNATRYGFMVPPPAGWMPWVRVHR